MFIPTWSGRNDPQDSQFLRLRAVASGAGGRRSALRPLTMNYSQGQTGPPGQRPGAGIGAGAPPGVPVHPNQVSVYSFRWKHTKKGLKRASVHVSGLDPRISV
jgi:hypothetical protein